MPLGVRGCTHATLKDKTSFPVFNEAGNLWMFFFLMGLGDVQLCPRNEEFPVLSASHSQYSLRPCILYTSLLPIEWFSEVIRVDGHVLCTYLYCNKDQTWSFKWSKSRNKVSVGGPAEGSLLI